MTAAARKAPARKAPAKRTPPRPATKTEDNIAAFDALRARARGSSLQVLTPAGGGPFILGPEEGFDPPLVVEWPQDLPRKIALEVAARNSNVVPFLQILLDEYQFAKVVAVLSQADDGDRLIIGVYLRIMEHFFGPGAGDVPGGTPASSTP